MRDLPMVVVLACGLLLVSALLGFGGLWLTRLRPVARRTQAWRAMGAALDLHMDPVSSRWLSPALRGERAGVAIECALVPLYKSHVATAIVASLDPPLDVVFVLETSELASYEPRGLALVSLGVAGLDTRCRVRAGDRGRLDDFVSAGAGNAILRFLEAMPAPWRLRVDDRHVVLSSNGVITDARFLDSAVSETAKLARTLLDLRSLRPR